MSNRPKYPKEDYFTPPWVTLSLLMTGILRDATTVLEPCAGMGSIVKALRGVGFDWHITAIEIESDFIEDLAATEPTVLINDDFLHERINKASIGAFDLVIINPPYSKIEEFIKKSLDLTNEVGRVCALLRLGHLAGIKRGKFLKDYVPSEVLIFCRRPSFSGTAADIGGYCWVIWDKPLTKKETVLRWVA